MTNPQQSPTEWHSLPNDPKWDLVQRVAASRYFDKSARLRDFLLYVCHRTLTGRTGEVTEQHIGYIVFERKPDYNPNEDNIVRVEARQVRQRLEAYFSAEGREEPVIIHVPKGRYIPVFEARALPPAEAAQPPGLWMRRIANVAPWVLVAALGTLCAFLWRTREIPESASVPAPASRVWQEVFRKDRQTIVVIADSTFALLQDLTAKKFRLDDYMGGKFQLGLKPGRNADRLDSVLPLIAGRQHTSLADVNLALRILQANSGFSDRTSVRFARTLHIRDFKSNNLIMLGSARSNPWVSLFNQWLNFEVEYDPSNHTRSVRNRKPGPREPDLYRDTEGIAHSVIALLPTTSRDGNVLIIAGTSMESTEAAGEALSDPDVSERLLKAIGVAPGQKVGAFEMLLKSRVSGGAARDTELVVFRRPL